MVALNQPAFYAAERVNQWVCLSTDAKPTSSTEGYRLYNGDQCIEMDTSKKYVYSIDSDAWVLQPFDGFAVDDYWFTMYQDGQTGKWTLTANEEAIQGAKGDKGDPFTIDKIYNSIAEMNADHDNPLVPIGSFILIENEADPQDTDNGKLYDKTEHGFSYITNLSGAQGIKGEKGETGIGIPHGGHTGQILTKTNEMDYATHWEDPIDLSNYPTKDDLDGLLLPAVNGEDEGKIAVVVDGEWQAGHIEYGEIIHATGSSQLNGSSIPTFSNTQMESIYNTFISGHSVIISDVNGVKHYKVLSVDASDENNITAKILFEDKFIITYNKLGQVASFTPIPAGQIVVNSREYGVYPNDHGYLREWSANTQGKVWAECGVFATTAAILDGINVQLPVVFEDNNFHVQVSVAEKGNYCVGWYRATNTNSVNVYVRDNYGTAKAVKICVEAKGWKA